MATSLIRDLPIPFDAYEIHGVKEYEESGNKFCEQVSDEKADYWSLYGHIPGQGLSCIGDFDTREYAEETYARITGQRLFRGWRLVTSTISEFRQVE